MELTGLFIDGGFVAAEGSATYPSINPADGQPWCQFAAASSGDVDRAVAAARASFDSGIWRDRSAPERAAVLRRAADLFSEYHGEIAMAEIQDSGATLRKANGADLIAANLSFQEYANMIEATPLEQRAEEFFPIASENIIRREPVGVVAAIVPFNFPLAAASWKVAPALAAGCSMVLKPSPYTPATALWIAKVMKEAGLPDGVLNVITGPGPEIGAQLVEHPDVDKVAFTGSTHVGRIVGASAGRQIKRCMLELGGKSANIILDDANLDVAVPVALFATFFHSGQVCESGTRILVPRNMHDEFVQRLVDEAARVKLGHPMEMETTMGPLVSAEQLANSKRYVALAIDEGATVACGGEEPEDLKALGGYYFPPTILTDVTNEMRIAQEEVFGPVVVVIPYDDEADAVRIANDSPFGLAAALWTQDEARALRLARHLKAGTIWINDYHMISPKYPFGGFKASGVGRELGLAGLDAYFELKHIHVARTNSLEEKHYLPLTLSDLDL